MSPTPPARGLFPLHLKESQQDALLLWGKQAGQLFRGVLGALVSCRRKWGLVQLALF